MSQKKARSTPAKSCVCTHCKTQAHAIPNTLHRKCSGNVSSLSYEMNNQIVILNLAPKAMRGVWI